MFSVLLNKITSLLEATDKFADVFGYEAQQFDTDPIAIVSPSGNESDYSTTRENERIYAYSVKLFVSRTARGGDSEKEADRVLRDIVDSTINAFDADYTFSGLTVPSGYCMINVFAVPSQWGYAGEEDEYRVAEIIVRCRVSVDVNVI